jgi:hypothetical protein
MQVECKWCGEFSRDNLNHKLYTSITTPLPIVYSMTLHESCIQMAFSPLDPQMGVPKLGLLLSQSFDTHIFLKSIFWNMQGYYVIALKRIFPTMYCMHNWRSFNPYSNKICGWESNSQFDSCLFF